ncbi:Hypothetical predicted protein [Octopus vulgaris]|uniref:Uncharacterized protein n=1 Tax=Octopus vulgaris TaxID=6645 RepID=A0AA36B0P9_OCTVU|nr:Hypothetical predicted protein [Octopus vulgaris]
MANGRPEGPEFIAPEIQIVNRESLLEYHPISRIMRQDSSVVGTASNNYAFIHAENGTDLYAFQLRQRFLKMFNVNRLLNSPYDEYKYQIAARVTARKPKMNWISTAVTKVKKGGGREGGEGVEGEEEDEE